MWQMETQLFASSYIWLAYIFEARYSRMATPYAISKKSSVDQSELWLVDIGGVSQTQKHC